MHIFSWGLRRQLAVFVIFAAATLLIVVGGIYYFRPEPTCFDSRQNQDEEGVDCGGAEARCAPCSEKIHDLTILWTRFFPLRGGVVDAAALVQNGNQFLKTKKLVYAVKLYDENGILIAIRENSTFVHPGEKFLIFEPNLEVQNREPKSALVEFRSVSWESGEDAPLKIDVTRKNILLEDTFSPRLEVSLKNQANQTYDNIEAAALILGQGGAVLGVSRTIVDSIGISADKSIVFTWPEVIPGAEKADILLRQAP